MEIITLIISAVVQVALARGLGFCQSARGGFERLLQRVYAELAGLRRRGRRSDILKRRFYRRRKMEENIGMNTEREKIINIAYRVYKAHGSREAIKADTKYGEFVVIDEKGNPVEEGIERVIEVMERLQEENKK